MVRRSIKNTPILVFDEFVGPPHVADSSFKGQIALESSSGKYYKSREAGREVVWDLIDLDGAGGGGTIEDPVAFLSDPEATNFIRQTSNQSSTEALSNPETAQYSAVMNIVESQLPPVASVPFFFASLGDARPHSGAPSVEWIGTGQPYDLPVNAIPGDFVTIYAPAAIPWAPGNDVDTKITFLRDATSNLPAFWVDSSGGGRNANKMASGNFGSDVVIAANQFGTRSGVQFLNVGSVWAGLRTSLSGVTAKTHVVIAAHVRFPDAGTYNRNAWSLGGTGAGQYSIFKDTTGKLCCSVDGTTILTGPTIDSLGHSIVLHATATHVNLYLDGTKVIDAASTVPLGNPTTLTLGGVQSSGASSIVRPFPGGSLGDFTVAMTDTAPDIAGRIAWLSSRIS